MTPRVPAEITIVNGVIELVLCSGRSRPPSVCSRGRGRSCLAVILTNNIYCTNSSLMDNYVNYFMTTRSRPNSTTLCVVKYAADEWSSAESSFGDDMQAVMEKRMKKPTAY